MGIVCLSRASSFQGGAVASVASDTGDSRVGDEGRPRASVFFCSDAARSWRLRVFECAACVVTFACPRGGVTASAAVKRAVEDGRTQIICDVVRGRFCGLHIGRPARSSRLARNVVSFNEFLAALDPNFFYLFFD